MRLLGVEKLAEDSVLVHPLDKELGSECLVGGVHPHVLYDRVEVPDAVDSSLHVGAAKAQEGHLQLEHFGLLLSLVFGDEAFLEVVH